MRDLRWLAVFLLLLPLGGRAYGIKDPDNQGRWNKPTVNNTPDKEVPGFLVNLGPTGARAELAARSFTVRHIFKESPAEGRLKLGDVITGVFGKPFATHTFGGSPHGYEGPMMDLGLAIERAEGKDGVLLLDVQRGTSTETVKIPLEVAGTFSPTFPHQCAKSERIRARALQYLASSSDAQGVWQGHAKMAVTLALLSSDQPAQQAIGRRMALGWNQAPGADAWSWPVAFQLITLGEYYLLTNDASVLPTMKILSARLKEIQVDAKDGKIKVWVAKPGEDQAKLDIHQQLYEGGFCHGPYQDMPNKNGYGPMQYPTIFAVIAWQIAERCGVKVDPRGVKIAFDFIHRGTNASGYVAYGGEFTLNAGFIDYEGWKKSKGGDNYVGRSGASLIAHLMSPEFAASAQYADLNRGYLKSAYKSLPDGHADSNLGILWGLLGSATDESALRTMMDYHKAWFNMMRGHDGSFVLLPGRDYADDGYYMASRHHPTATMALVFGLRHPKLRIQGVQVHVPGLNPKTLTGTMLAAYQAVCAKAYGDAAKLLKGAGPEAQAIMTHLDGLAAKASLDLERLGASGRWTELSRSLAELRKSHGGIPSFDAGAAAWDERLKSPAGAALLAADRFTTEGRHGKAWEALQPALTSAESPAARAVKERMDATATAMLKDWDALEASGAWHRLKLGVDGARERWRGVAAVDDRIRKVDADLATDPGKVLAEADRKLEEGAPAGAITTLGTADSAQARGLRERVKVLTEKTVATLSTLEAEGRWHSLKTGLAKATTGFGGLPEFDARAKAWQEKLGTPEGRAWVTAEQEFSKGELGAAAKGAAPALRAKLDEIAKGQLQPLEELETKGDWYELERRLAGLRKKLGGLPLFDAKDAAWKAALKADPARSALQHGTMLARLREAIARKSTPALLKELEALADRAGESYYGKQARELLKNLKG